MNLVNYTLKVNNKILLKNIQVNFIPGKISHVIGKNGVGKSMFAKDFLFNDSKQISKEISQQISLISSAANIPSDISMNFLLNFLNNKFESDKKERLAYLLNLENIDGKILIKDLSDGQKQKLKLLSFLLEDKNIIILDEITNALDKRTVIEIHRFLNQFIVENPNKIIINITHNLSDLKEVKGDYYLFDNQEIRKFDSVERIIDMYINN